jgi:sec-independent protein translocase protein TatC
MARFVQKLPTIRVPRLPQVDPNTPDVFEEMTLQEHLEELTSRIKKVIIAIVIGFIGGFILAGPLLRQIVDYANVEASGLDIRGPAEPLTLYFKVAMYIAIALTLPFTVYQLIAFLAPGLTNKEKRVVYSSLPFVSILFVAGVAYGFFVAAPRALQFLSTFMTGVFSFTPDGAEVLNFFLTLMMGLGLAFQLPVVMFVLAKIGIVTAQKMRDYRKYAYLVLVIVAAIITPSTDPVNMGIVALPLVILYEFGAIISRIFAKTGLRQEAEAAEAAQSERDAV